MEQKEKLKYPLLHWLITIAMGPFAIALYEVFLFLLLAPAMYYLFIISFAYLVWDIRFLYLPFI